MVPYRLYSSRQFLQVLLILTPWYVNGRYKSVRTARKHYHNVLYTLGAQIFSPQEKSAATSHHVQRRWSCCQECMDTSLAQALGWFRGECPLFSCCKPSTHRSPMPSGTTLLTVATHKHTNTHARTHACTHMCTHAHRHTDTHTTSPCFTRLGTTSPHTPPQW